MSKTESNEESNVAVVVNSVANTFLQKGSMMGMMSQYCLRVCM